MVTFDFLVIVTNLPTMAKKLAIWLQRNHDGSEFFQVRDNVWLMAQLGYGSKMRYYLYRGVADLIAYSILAKSNRKGFYYVNNKLLNL